MRRPFAACAALSAAAAMFSLAGCGSSTSPAQTNFKSLSASEQSAVEDEAVIEVEANISSFATFNPTGGFGFAHVAPRRAHGLAQIVRGKVSHRPRFQTVGDCNPAIAGDTSDADADGIPANASATFSCDFSSNGDSSSEVGSVSFGDPTPSTGDIDYNATVNLTLAALSGSNGDENVTLTAQSALTQAPGTLTESDNSNVSLAITNAPNNENGSLKFKTNSHATYAYTGADLTQFGALPDGTFDLTGNWSYNVKSSALTANLSFAISTPGGLSIKASCQNNDGRIDSGEIDIKFGDGTLVKAVYTGCPAQPSITVS